MSRRPAPSTVPPRTLTAEHRRLADSEARRADWKHWGPYLAERAWGTVREDYSADGDAWRYFPFEHAHCRAYRWNEDGLAGICDRQQTLCLALALWNGRDPILKERLFGLANPQGNHGEDVKELYYFVDGSPTHSYLEMLYIYPQAAFPYEELIRENQRRSRNEGEYELHHAIGAALAQGRYFEVRIRYAKADQEDVLGEITATNRGPEAAALHLLPHLWYRNTWSWQPGAPRHALEQIAPGAVHTEHPDLGARWWYVSSDGDGNGEGNREGNSDGNSSGDERPPLLFTDNDTNYQRLYGVPNATPFVKDGIGEAVVAGRLERVNPAGRGSKVAAHVARILAPGASVTVRLRLSNRPQAQPFAGFDAAFDARKRETDAFYQELQRPDLSADERRVQRQAFAGLLWSKQFYHYSVERWLAGDPGQPPPPPQHRRGRNADWTHLNAADVISMPDSWEYPWFAAWDLAFHTLPLALLDPEWAKRQLILLLREWYMHPNGQLPAYEWQFSDVNPPVHAWAAWRVYKISRNVTGRADRVFLARVFHKLLLNFTWWVNRKDADGNNIFQGGFLGLDNIGVFDRSTPLPGGGHLEQADGTAWMGMYCLNMLAIALELAKHDPAYEDVATKFFVHFVYIADAINRSCGQQGLWDEEDGFYYDMVHTPDNRFVPVKLRSFVGLIPLFAVETLEPELLERLPSFRRRMRWLLDHRPHLTTQIAPLDRPGEGGRLLLSLVDRERLCRALERMLDPAQFLSPYGLRSLSREYAERPFTLSLNGVSHTVGYEPAESRSGLFGGNSNWRGPVWFPLNFLMIESLQKYYHYYGESVTVPFPSAAPNGSSVQADLWQVARELSRRLIALFLPNERGRRPALGPDALFAQQPWRDRLLFYEYFHGDDGSGLGASHQTGWTALVAKLIQQSGGAEKTGGAEQTGGAEKTGGAEQTGPR